MFIHFHCLCHLELNFYISKVAYCDDITEVWIKYVTFGVVHCWPLHHRIKQLKKEPTIKWVVKKINWITNKQKHYTKRESTMTLGQGLLVYSLVRPLLSLPRHSYMEKSYIIVDENILFTLGLNSKTKYWTFLVHWRCSWVSFSALRGRDVEICLKCFLYSVIYAAS